MASIELSCRDGHILTAKESENDAYVHLQCGGSTCREVTSDELAEARKYYREFGSCKFHVFEDTPTGCGYYSRDCIICNKNIGLI